MNAAAETYPTAAPYRNVHSHRRWTLIALILLLLSMAAVIPLGPKGGGIGIRESMGVLLHKAHVGSAIGFPTPSTESESIVWQLRAPRAVEAVLIGAILALAGVAFQGLLMNPLADPYTVGASAGAGLGAALAEVVGIAALGFGFVGAGCAFLTAMIAVSIVYALARVNGRVQTSSFLLAGVVVGTFLWAQIPLMMFITGRNEDLQRIMFYLIGSLYMADWTRVWLLAPVALITYLALVRSQRELNLMTLGEETAAHLGVDTERVKRRVIITGSLATAAAVSVAGIIGFVGLVAPHSARKLVGPDHRALIPLAALFGATLMVISDTIVRVWLDEMPAGVVTSLIGAPLFCLLLRSRITREAR